MWDRSGSSTRYSDPFPRGGESGLFSIDVIEAYGNAAVTLTVHHRDDDRPRWSTAGIIRPMAPGFATKRIGDLKRELQIEVRASCAESDGFVLYQGPEIQWL